jgi:hypothetical protein
MYPASITLYFHNTNKVIIPLIAGMSESTSGPSRRRKAPPNPYSQAEQHESLALFLAARNIPVPSILKRPVQEKDCSPRSNNRRRRVEHENSPEARSYLLVSRGISHCLDAERHQRI